MLWGTIMHNFKNSEEKKTSLFNPRHTQHHMRSASYEKYQVKDDLKSPTYYFATLKKYYS